MVCSYETIAQTNAGNYLARRSLEDVRSSAGQYHVRTATQVAIPSEGPTNKIFKPASAKFVNTMEYEQEQLNQLCGRLQRKTESLNHRHWEVLISRQG